MLSREILLMSKKLYRKIKQIVVEWPQQIMVDQVVAAEVVVVVCVGHHQEWVVDGDPWVVNQILVEVVAMEMVVIDLVAAAVVVAMEPVEIMLIDQDLMVVAMVVIWEEVVVVVA
jgi:hypothetical protein